MIDVIVDDGVDMRLMPDAARVAEAARTACAVAGFPGGEPELCVRFADDAAVRELNRDWRARDRVTDVLSFPMQEAPVDPAAHLGDIVLAVPFVGREAARLALPPADHALHLIVHGVLHLSGYDHEDDDEAERMQALERQALARMGLHDPYPGTAEEKADVG